jgi:signal transduction histidine kinase
MLKGRDNNWTEVKDSLTISFSALRPGSYELFAKTTNADSYESEPIKISSFTVQKPFWQQWPFFLLTLLATIFATAFVVKESEKAKRKKKEMKAMLQQSLQDERERISKDLHDHLGANLATIIAQTDNIEARLYKGDIDKASVTVQHLSSQTRETMNVLRETIWAVQESEHSLEEFIIRIRTFLQRLYESTSITWEVKNLAEKQIVFSPTQTLHLFRIIQEASQNIVKHAKATEAKYHFSLTTKGMQILIADNGIGFNTGKVNITNGLINMSERVKTLEGTLNISVSNGTTILIVLPN